MELPNEITPALREVLGLPNFTTGPIAHAFRAAGANIRTKCEDEQAYVLFWLLKLAIEHGDNWRKVAGDELAALKEKIERKTTLTEQAALTS